MVDDGDRLAGLGQLPTQRPEPLERRTVEQDRDVELGQRLITAAVVERGVPSQEVEALADRIGVDDQRLFAEREQQPRQRHLGPEAVAVGVLVAGQQETPVVPHQIVKRRQGINCSSPVPRAQRRGRSARSGGADSADSRPRTHTRHGRR